MYNRQYTNNRTRGSQIDSKLTKNRTKELQGFGQPWSSLVNFGLTLLALVIDVQPWSPLVSYGKPCSDFVSLGHPWSSMASYGQPWLALVSLGKSCQPWEALFCFGQLWSSMVNHCHS
jgi:hypothetical protein